MLGDVKEVHLDGSTHLAAGHRPPGRFRRNAEGAGLGSVAWAGAGAAYHPAYHPFKWRGFGTGTGAVGDMGATTPTSPTGRSIYETPRRSRRSLPTATGDCAQVVDHHYTFPSGAAQAGQGRLV